MSNLVSINCITYNHEKYIAQAIESFLMQETDFDFEILIHDDASTDRTPSIIKEYELKYPDKIKVIYQKENQYSKGIKVSRLNVSRATGKYIAICEGDDYWISPYKLQKQVDYMENNPSCSLCVHAGQLINESKDKKVSDYTLGSKSRKFNTEEVIRGGGALFLTNSMLYRAEYKDSYPAFFENSPVGDYPLAINLSLLGEVYYVNEIMSAYRQSVIGSWSNRVLSNGRKIITHYEKMLVMLDELNQYTDYKYKKVIEVTKKDNYLPIYLAKKEMDEFSKAEVKSLYAKLSFKRKLILLLNNISPNIIKSIKTIYTRLKS